MESSMRKVLRRHRAGYAISLLLLVVGLTLLLVALWNAWPASPLTGDFLSTVWTSLWTKQLNIVSGLEFKLVYFAILGVTMLAFGVATLALSRQWLLLAGRNSLFQCPFCRKRWRASRDKGLVECPQCRQLVHPRLVE
jgi:uncharacterized membrane protein YiaA